MKSPVNNDERPQLGKQAPPLAQQQHTPLLPIPCEAGRSRCVR